MLPLGWGLVSTYDLGSFPFLCLLFVNDDLLIFNNVRAFANQRMIWICDIEQHIFRRNHWKRVPPYPFPVPIFKIVKVRNPERVEPQRNLTVSKSDVFSVQVVCRRWLLKYVASSSSDDKGRSDQTLTESWRTVPRARCCYLNAWLSQNWGRGGV